MPAPSSSRIVPLAVALLVALVAAGCTVPGSSRLQGPPEGLPPSLDYVTADVMGFSLYATDPASKRWAGSRALAEPTLAAMQESVFGDPDGSSWIGDNEGIAVRELQTGETSTPATLYFADVRSRSKLEAFLSDADWKVAEDTGQEAPPQEWERSTGDYRALAVYDDAVIAATDREALEKWIDAADEYAVPDRKAMSEYAVEASRRVPAAFVYRFDLLRTQLRRPFEGDPATNELARWATDSNLLVATRDGWIGIAPPLPETDAAARIVGASEWVPELAPDIELEPADRELLTQADGAMTIGVALHDPGQQLRELVRAITYGYGQYATEQDVPEDDQVELLPVLDALDGDAAVTWNAPTRTLTVRVEVEEPREVAADVSTALEQAGLANRSQVSVEAGGVLEIRVSDGPVGKASAQPAATFRSDVVPALDAAGKPPRPPVAWLFVDGGDCTGPVGGWVTWDGTDELRWSLSVDELGTCPDTLALTTLAQLGVSLPPR